MCGVAADRLPGLGQRPPDGVGSHASGMGSDASDFDLFNDEEHLTVVDSSFWNQPQIPEYPALATFGPYEILGRIARGGMAEVYLAREWDEEGKARHLVVKRILPEMEHNQELLQMFLEEGRIAVRLYHPNVCHVYECGELEGTTFMALEWVYGPSLRDIIRRARGGPTGALPWPLAVEVAAQVATALHYVHQAKGVGGKPLNIVHRDVSPHNVMLSWSGSVKLLDFGIAKTSHEATSSGKLVGKYQYMSPEQAQSMHVDARSDIFTLGIVLFEMLTGKTLYDRPTLLDTLSAIVREPAPSLREERPDLPEALDRIIQRALAKDPASRFQDAGELRASLRQVLRAHDQDVTEQRMALYLEGLFEAEDKVPLRPEGQQLTGSFQALTKEGAAAAAALLEPEITFEGFADGRSSPVPGASVDQNDGSAARGVSFWLAIGALGLVAAVIGAAIATWLMG